MRYFELLVILIVFTCLVTAPVARADTLHTDVDRQHQGYWPVEERSFETFVEAGLDHRPELRVRLAIHNTSAEDHDFVARLALPRNCELLGFARNIGGQWEEGTPVQDSLDIGQRDPSSVYAHILPPTHTGALPSAELIGYGLESGSTTQVELRLRIYPTLNGDHWQVTLPSRQPSAPNLAPFREVFVKGLREREGFRVDGQSNGTDPKIRTRAIDSVTISWPANFQQSSLLSGDYEFVKDPTGAGGKVHVHLRLGNAASSKPDHVLLIVDRSRSTEESLIANSAKVFSNLLNLLPKSTTFDAISFARNAKPLLPTASNTKIHFPRADHQGSRESLLKALKHLPRTQGSDLSSAFRLAKSRLVQRKAKKPVLIVISDGVLPQLVNNHQLKESLGKFAQGTGGASNRMKANIIFIIDDPLIARNSGAQSHPIVALAGFLGAKLRFASMADFSESSRPEDLHSLLRAPSVLDNLRVRWPKYIQSVQQLPKQLIAGHVLHLTAETERRPPSQLHIRGDMQGGKISTRLKRIDRPASAQAFVTIAKGVGSERNVHESLARPGWYSRALQRKGQHSIEASSRIGQKKSGTLDRDILRFHLRTRVLPRARACYNRSLQSNNVQSGQVKLDIEVGKGEVMFAQIAATSMAYPDPDFHSCLIDAAWALDVPSGNMDQKTYRLMYPLTFVAPEGGRPPQTHPPTDTILDAILPNP